MTAGPVPCGRCTARWGAQFQGWVVLLPGFWLSGFTRCLRPAPKTCSAARERPLRECLTQPCCWYPVESARLRSCSGCIPGRCQPDPARPGAQHLLIPMVEGSWAPPVIASSQNPGWRAQQQPGAWPHRCQPRSLQRGAGPAPEGVCGSSVLQREGYRYFAFTSFAFFSSFFYSWES